MVHVIAIPSLTSTLQAYVKEHLKFRLEFRSWEELVEVQPTLTDAQMKHYQQPGKTVFDVFNDGKLHVDFVRGWGSCPFNVEARGLFIEDFISVVKDSKWYHTPPIPVRYLTEYHVGKALDTYMDTCRRCYKAVLSPPSPTAAKRRAEASRQTSRKATVSTLIVRNL